jgi:hypothetical protein
LVRQRMAVTLDTSPAATREVQDRLEQVAHLQSPPDEANSIQAALAHGGILNDLLPTADAMLKALIAEARISKQDVVHSPTMKRQLAARTSARRYRVGPGNAAFLTNIMPPLIHVRARATPPKRDATQ